MKSMDGRLLYVLQYKKKYLLCSSEVMKIENGEVYLTSITEEPPVPVPYSFVERYLVHIVGEYEKSEYPLA